MATTDEIYERLGKLIEVLENGGNGGNSGGGTPSARGYFSGYGRLNKRYTLDDFESGVNKYREKIGDVENGRTRDYEKVDEDIVKNTEKLLNLEEEIKGTLQERLELQEKLRDGTIDDKELARLEELIEKEEELNSVREKGLSLAKEREDMGGAMGKWGGYVKNFINGVKTMYSEAKKLAEPWYKMDQAASKYSRTLGMTGKAYEKFRDDTISNISDNKVAATTGLKGEELIEAQTKYVSQMGRNVSVDNKSQVDIGLIKKLTDDKGLEFASHLDKFGIGISDAAKITADMYNDAVKSGLSFEEISSNVSKNLNVAQNYTFKNGIKGLESMAKKAAAVKLDIQEVAKLAEKVSTVEGAVETSAQLQVLGGPFAQLADPMGMLNEGLNDMEGLYDRVSKMIGGLGGFNKETGEVEVSSFNKQRIKAAANAMGMDYGQLMESVNTQARRNEVTKQVSSNAALSGLDKDTQELLINQASFKDGKAGVSINGEFKDLESLAGTDAAELKEMLKAQAATEKEDLKSIVINTRSGVEQTEAMNAQIEALNADNLGGAVGETLKSIENFVSWLPIIHGVVLAIQLAEGVGNILDAFGGKGKGLRKLGKWGKKGINKVKGLFGKSSAKGAANVISNTSRSATSAFSNASRHAVYTGPKGKMVGLDGRTSMQRLNQMNGGMWGKVKNAGGRVWEGTKNLGGKAWGGMKSAWGGATKLGGKAWGGMKSAWNGATKLGGKALGGISKLGKSALFKAGGKTAVKGGLKAVGIMGRLGKAAAAGGGIASVATVVGELGSIGTDYLVESGKIKKGGAAHHALSAGSSALSGAAMGAAIGSVIPGVGTAVGAIVGGVAGAVRGLWKSGGIQQAFNGVKNFAKKSWGKIKNSKIGKAIGKGINKIKNSKFGKAVSKGINKIKNSKVGKAVGSAIKSIGNFLGFGKKKKTPPPPPPPKAKSQASDILNNYTAKIKPVLEKGTIATAGAVAKANNDVHVTSDPQDINLNGTLNLKSENGQSIDLMSELKSNPTLLRNLTDMISNEMTAISKGGNIVQHV